VRLLLDALDRPLVQRADVAGQELLLGLELLAPDAIPAFVVVEVDVLVGHDRLPQRLREILVALLGRTDEVVRGDLEVRPELAEARAHLRSERDWRLAALLRLALDLQSVLIGAREHARLVAAQQVIATER